MSADFGKSRDRCANHVINGFRFQTVAAISILLDNLEDFSSIKDEGEEDIIIRLNSNKTIYAQAKASYKNNSPNAAKQFKSGIITLAEDVKKGDYSKLIYISNVECIFGNKTNTDYIRPEISIGFGELGTHNQKIIKNRLQEAGIPSEYFFVQYLRYSGEDKEQWIRSKMIEKFNSMGIEEISVYSVLDSWKNYLDANASGEDKKKFCSKKQMSWGMIIHYLDPPSQITDGCISSFPSNEYSQVIRSLVGNFAIVSRILGDYTIKNSLNGMQMTSKEYAKNTWKEYVDLLDSIDYDEHTKECILRTVLTQIIDKSSIIVRVKKVMKIED